MARRLGTAAPRPQHAVRDKNNVLSPRPPFGERATTRQERFPMQWQTPTATDFRFGFEITMYVANR